MLLPNATLEHSITGVLVLFISLFVGVQRVLPRANSEYISRGAKVFIEKMDGFEDNFVAALHKKQVPVVIVTDRDKADFVFSGYYTINQEHVEANVKAVNKDGTVVFAYDFVQDYALHGKQSAAEACAKNLKKEILSRSN
jgi:hypothetical protein